MSHPARGPSLLGIDGKAIAAGRRHASVHGSKDPKEAARMSHPARGPSLLGIDGKAIAAGRRRTSARISIPSKRRPA
jgi:hypothetical protein